MRDPDDVSGMERRYEKELDRRVPDMSGADVGQRHRRGVLTVSADLDKAHVLAELKGAVEEIGRLMDEIEDLQMRITELEQEGDRG